MRWLRGDSHSLASGLEADAISEAHRRIADAIHRTPVLESTWLNRRHDCRFYFKCENLQRGGAFKIRGAMNAVGCLDTESAERGVVTHSSGNHAQALAIAAGIRQIPCTVVMPETAPEVKVQATRDYGARVVVCPPTLADRESTTQQVMESTGATLIHPYDDHRIIQGQATCAKELIEQVPDLNWLAAPIGGGGLMAGTCLAANHFSPGTSTLAAEPKGANDAVRGFESGERVLTHHPQTIADGLLTTVGEKTWQVVYPLVTEWESVSDDEILQAMRFFWERMKLVVEPSGAVALAAVLKRIDSGQWQVAGQRIGLIVSGGNRLFVGG